MKIAWVIGRVLSRLGSPFFEPACQEKEAREKTDKTRKAKDYASSYKMKYKWGFN